MILLFRPFGSKKQMAGISASPWELCTASANSIITLLKLYRSRFSLRYMVNLSVHMLFTASIVHLVNATSANESLQRSSKNALRICISAFEEIGEVWVSALKSLQVVKSLQQKWQLKTPTSNEGEFPHQQWPNSYPPVTKNEYDFDPVMPPMSDQQLADAYVTQESHLIDRSQGFQQYFMPPPAQNVVPSVDHQNAYHGNAFWDYLPFLESGYEGQQQQQQPHQPHQQHQH